MDLKKLIKEHVNNPAVTDPEDQTMNLADALLPFYQSRTRPPAQKPYTPTHVDLETMILPILNNTWMLPDNKRMSIFRTIDDWYGCLTYTPILGASNSEIDSAVVLSELTQSPTIPGKPDAAAIFLEKRLGEPTVPTERPAKRPRMDSFESPTALQPQVAAPVVSPDRSFSQDQSQDFSHSQSASEPTQKVYCLEEHCNTRISGRSDINGMRIHYAQSHFATGVFLCPVPGCHEGFERKDRYFRKNGHFCQKHGYSPNDGVSWDELVRKLVPTEITDVFHDKCPVCEKKESFETYKEYAKHRDKHLEREIPNHPYHDRCSERAIHHWRQSRCIPEEYRREIDAKKKPGKSCADPVLSTHKDQDNNGNGPSGPSGPGSYSSDGFPNPAGSASQGSRDPNTSSDSNNHGGSYSSPYSARASTAIFTPISSNLHSSSRILSEGENRRTAAPGINLIKKCFKSIRKLGRGGFGSVDEVICKSTNKSYARKIIPLDQTTTKVSTEVEILKHLRHQHIINLAAYCTTPDQLWMFMTPVAENDLATYLRGDASCGITLPDRELLRTWESCLASALEYLHINGLVHGDIKPQNILVSSDLNIYLADFGSARTYVESSHGTDARPASALTPKYSAPEVSYYKSIGYNWEMGAAADIFSLGCVWAEMETVYTGLSIQVFETFRSGDSAYNSFQANLPKTYAWLDFLWVLQESVLQTSRDWTYAPSSLKIAKDMLSFDPHQRPNVDLVTTVFHCTCSSDSPVMWYPDLPYYRPSSTSLAEVSSHCVADGLSPAKQINMTLNIKPLNYWNATTEGFSSNGRIDGFYDWGTNTPTKCYSFWQVARATSAAPVYFGTKTNDCGPFSDLPKFQVLDGDANMFDIVIGEDLLQVT
jgi:serine/threonine protein kinase